MNGKEWNEKEKKRKWATEKDELLTKEDLFSELREILSFAEEHNFTLEKTLICVRDKLEDYPKTFGLDKEENVKVKE